LGTRRSRRERRAKLSAVSPIFQFRTSSLAFRDGCGRRTCPLRLEIGDLMRGREQATLRGPQFANLVAVAFMKDVSVGDREDASDVLGREVFRIGVKIGRQRNRSEGHEL